MQPHGGTTHKHMTIVSYDNCILLFALFVALFHPRQGMHTGVIHLGGQLHACREGCPCRVFHNRGALFWRGGGGAGDNFLF